MNKKLLIFVPVRNLGHVITETLNKIPKSFENKISMILINDNNSENFTKEIIEKYKQHCAFKILINYFDKNIGFGGSKKSAYLYAIKKKI